MMYKEYFLSKKIAVIGLGPHMEMVPDIKFLTKCKTSISLFELRSESRLGDVPKQLIDAGVNYEARMFESKDITNFDLIVVAPDIDPKATIFVEARTKGIAVESSQTLFLKLAPPVTLVGVMGTCGKSTVAYLIFEMLKNAFVDIEEQNVWYIDAEGTSGTLAHLRKVTKNDIVIARIRPGDMELYHSTRISPHVAVFTTVDVSDPGMFLLLGTQTYNNFLIANDAVIDSIKSIPGLVVRAKILRTGVSLIPEHWSLRLSKYHDRENISLALRVAELFKVSSDISREVTELFGGLKGRVEPVKKLGSIEFYNDAAAITPLATLAALRALSNNRNIILIMGGKDIGEDMSVLINNLAQYTAGVVLLPGSGTMKLHRLFISMDEVKHSYAHTLEEAVQIAYDLAGEWDRILFSPAFEVSGVEASRKERGDKFIKAVRSL